jgi:D-alanyl-D-alanine carboxypeptidase/D-alanyl-D-alanine-endopeptidase (penicillin-binding protein 4)
MSRAPVVSTPDHTDEPVPGAADESTSRGGRARSLVWRIALIALVVACATAAGVVIVAQNTTSSDDDATHTTPTDPAEPAALALADPPAPSDVLSPASGASVTSAALRRQLGHLLSSKRLGDHVAYAFATLDGRRPLITSGADDLVTPASTLKLLTTTAALDALGPAHRFTTTVVRVRGTDRIILVGGGDPLLVDVDKRGADTFGDFPVPASLADLAAATRRALVAQGLGAVRLSFDDSLFAGPAVSPRWEPTYIPESIVSPVTALWVNEGREKPGLTQRSADPSLAAARRFARLLRADGVKVRGAVARTAAPRDARRLAEVDSPRLTEIVEHTLEVSDNEAAEVLLRQTALAAGRPGSFTGGVAAVRATMRSLGVDLDGARIFDGSGLSRDDLLPVQALIEVLQAAARADEPSIRPVVTALPVAGFNGSLAYRFTVDAPRGLGLVRAKTGTLTGVHGLAGIAVPAEGEPIVFATIADQVPVPKTLAARAQLDRIAAAAAACC